jgi:hypothetical protein
VKGLINENFKYISATVALFIVVETSVLYYDSSSWWKPVGLLIGLLAVLLIWKNAKTLVKSVLSIIMMLVFATFAVMSGYSLTASATGGAVWGCSIIAGYSIFLMISSFMVSTRNKWLMAIAASFVQFVVSYSFMPFGVLVLSLVGLASGVIAFALFMRSLDFFTRHSKNYPKNATDFDYTSLSKSMKNLSRKYHEGTARIKTNHRVYYGAGLPTYVFIPMKLDAEFKENKKGRLSYHKRNVLHYLAYWFLKSTYAIRQPNAIVVFIDTMGWNTASKDEPKILALPNANSSRSDYVGLMNGLGSNKTIMKTVRQVYMQFANAVVSTDKDVRTITKRLTTDIVDKKPKEESNA